MKVRGIISKVVDNYMRIVVEVYDTNTHLIAERYYIEPHSVDRSNIPESVLNKEVGMIVPFFDSLAICVDKM